MSKDFIFKAHPNKKIDLGSVPGYDDKFCNILISTIHPIRKLLNKGKNKFK